MRTCVAGDITLGLGLMEQAAEQAQALGALYERASIVAWLADAYLRSGRIQEAIEFAGRAFELADHSQQQGKRAHRLRMLGKAYAAGDPAQFAQAESFYKRALELATHLGMCPLQAHCVTVARPA